MEYTVHRLGVGSVFRVSFVLYGILGLFMAFLYGMMFLFLSRLGASALGPGMDSVMRLGGGLGAVALFFVGIAFAIFYAAFSAAMTAGAALTYNLLAGWVGGIKVTLLSPRLAAPESGSFAYPQMPVVPPPAPPARPPVPPEWPPAPPFPPETSPPVAGDESRWAPRPPAPRDEDPASSPPDR